MAELPSVADVLKQLRAELVEATQEGEGQDIRFTMGDIQIELEAVVESGGKGGLNLKVLGVGFEGGAEASSASTVKLTLNLAPTMRDEDGTRSDLRASRPLETE